MNPDRKDALLVALAADNQAMALIIEHLAQKAGELRELPDDADPEERSEAAARLLAEAEEVAQKVGVYARSADAAIREVFAGGGGKH